MSFHDVIYHRTDRPGGHLCFRRFYFPSFFRFIFHPVFEPFRRSLIMDKNSECEEAVLNLIKGNPLGYCQNALWKELDIDSRKCSRIVKKLLDAGLITRENTVVSGSRTYLLKAVGVEKQNNYELLVAGEVFSPCTGCLGKCIPASKALSILSRGNYKSALTGFTCVPEECPELTDWITELSDDPASLIGCYGRTTIRDILIGLAEEEIEESGAGKKYDKSGEKPEDSDDPDRPDDYDDRDNDYKDNNYNDNVDNDYNDGNDDYSDDDEF